MVFKLFPIIILALTISLQSGIALAGTQNSGVQPLQGFEGTIGQNRVESDLPGAIGYIVNFFLILASVIAGIMIVYGGVQYITAGLEGDSGQADKAKRTVIYAVIGLIVIGLSAVIVNFAIRSFTGL